MMMSADVCGRSHDSHMAAAFCTGNIVDTQHKKEEKEKANAKS